MFSFYLRLIVWILPSTEFLLFEIREIFIKKLMLAWQKNFFERQRKEKRFLGRPNFIGQYEGRKNRGFGRTNKEKKSHKTLETKIEKIEEEKNFVWLSENFQTKNWKTDRLNKNSDFQHNSNF